VRLLVNWVDPKEGMSICDPTCGSGGMLIESRKYMEQTGGDPRNLVLDFFVCSNMKDRCL
jgi:type I restriction enzyme M protein